MELKTIIIRPNGKEQQYGVLKDLSAIEPPLWIAILANYFRAEAIIDAEVEHYTENQVLEKVREFDPERVIIFCSGTHPSAHIQQKQVALKLEILLNKHIRYVETYDKLFIDPTKYGPPRWDLLPMEKYRAHNWHSWSNNSIRYPYGVIYTSLGCPFNCSFCCIKDFYGTTFQQRTLESVMEDFDKLHELGIKNIKIMDELFIFNPNRVMMICEELIKKNYDFNIWAYARIDIMTQKLLVIMKKAGINWLAYGIESGNDEIRKTVMKGNFDKNKIRNIIKMTKDSGINALGNYMFGFWDDTLDTMQETLDFAKELNCEYANFYCTVAYPGSKLYDDMLIKGISLPTDYNQYAQMSPDFKPLPTQYVSAKTVLEFRDKAFTEYYTRQEYLKMMLIKFGSQVAEEIGAMSQIKLTRKW